MNGLFYAKSSAQNSGLKLVEPDEETPTTSTTSPSSLFGVNNTVIQAGPGDDTSPPNSVKASRMNGISIPFSSSAGWSQHAPHQKGVYPSHLDYHVKVTPQHSLEFKFILEYTNPHHHLGSNNNESMMVKLSVAKTQLHGTEELALVCTKFQEFVNGKWLDITADVDYTATADEVVDAVLNDPNCGQTAGKATLAETSVDVTLGPFSHRARVVLTYQAESVYTYQAMAVNEKDSIGTHCLCPILIALPFAPIQNEAGLASFSVTVSAPSDSKILSLTKGKRAYMNLKHQEPLKSTTLIAITDLVVDKNKNDSSMAFHTISAPSLPPTPCSVLAWLALPNQNDDDFVDVGRELEKLNLQNDTENALRAVVQVPSQQDVASLKVPLPGHGPMGNLRRIKVTMPKAQARQEACLILNLQISDQSGSTGITVHRGGDNTSMRQRFNQLAELRFLKRLESIPALVAAGVLLPNDCWMDVFCPFDGQCNIVSKVAFQVGQVVNEIESIVAAVRSFGISSTASGVSSEIGKHIQTIRNVQPGGSTDFTAAPQTILRHFDRWLQESKRVLSAKAACCTFVEFDTDGGHNGRNNYLDVLQELCKKCHVRNGVVSGFGSWLDQDCASKVAKVIGTLPAQLSLEVPQVGAEGLNVIFRRGFSAWVQCLRQAPSMTLKVSAGGLSFPVPDGRRRNANAMEVLAVRRCQSQKQRPATFGPPDVSDETFTATVLENVASADELLLYIVSRFI